MDKNKVRFGLKNAHYAKFTYDKETKTYTYQTPVAIPGSVNLTLDVDGSIEPFYADDIVYYNAVSNNGYSGSLEQALISEAFKKDILGFIENSELGLLIEKVDVEPSPFALLFEVSGDQNNYRYIFYNVTVSRPSQTAATIEATKTPQTETMDLAAAPRENDGVVKAYAVEGGASYANFFAAVVEPTIPTTQNTTQTQDQTQNP